MQHDQKLRKLYHLLDEAENLVSGFTGGYSGNFLSADEFYNALSNSIKKLKRGDTGELERLYIWFLPTCAWDDFTIPMAHI